MTHGQSVQIICVTANGCSNEMAGHAFSTQKTKTFNARTNSHQPPAQTSQDLTPNVDCFSKQETWRRADGLEEAGKAVTRGVSGDRQPILKAGTSSASPTGSLRDSVRMTSALMIGTNCTSWYRLSDTITL